MSLTEKEMKFALSLITKAKDNELDKMAKLAESELKRRKSN